MKLCLLTRHRWENNIKTHFKDMHVYVEYICIFQSRVPSQATAHVVTNTGVPKMAGKFSICLETLAF